MEKMTTIKVSASRVDRLKKFFDELDENEAALKEAKQAAADLKEMVEEKTPRVWNWKQMLWAGISGTLGVGVAYLLHKRLPALNQAACSVTGVMAADVLGVRKSHAAIIGAGTGITGVWAHDNFPLLEVTMAGVSYGDAIFSIGEDFKEGVDTARADMVKRKTAKAAQPKSKSK